MGFGVSALRFFKKAIQQHGLPEKITIDQSDVNTAALEACNEDPNVKIEVRQIKYLNNQDKQDHRAIKRIVRPMQGLKTFLTVKTTLQDI